MIESIIKEIKKAIKKHCQNPEDYEAFVERGLKYDIKAAAAYFNCTPQQFVYACERALLSIKSQ